MRTRRQFHNFTTSRNATISRNCEIVVWDNFTTSPHPLYPVGVRGEVAKLSLHRREAVRGPRNCQPTGRARTPHKALQPRQGKETPGTCGARTGERGRHRRERGRLAPTSTRRPPAPVGTVSDPTLRPQAEVTRGNRVTFFSTRRRPEGGRRPIDNFSPAEVTGRNRKGEIQDEHQNRRRDRRNRPAARSRPRRRVCDTGHTPGKPDGAQARRPDRRRPRGGSDGPATGRRPRRRTPC